jgi:hypothetical protein
VIRRKLDGDIRLERKAPNSTEQEMALTSLSHDPTHLGYPQTLRATRSPHGPTPRWFRFGRMPLTAADVREHRSVLGQEIQHILEAI